MTCLPVRCESATCPGAAGQRGAFPQWRAPHSICLMEADWLWMPGAPRGPALSTCCRRGVAADVSSSSSAVGGPQLPNKLLKWQRTPGDHVIKNNRGGWGCCPRAYQRGQGVRGRREVVVETIRLLIIQSFPWFRFCWLHPHSLTEYVLLFLLIL